MRLRAAVLVLAPLLVLTTLAFLDDEAPVGSRRSSPFSVEGIPDGYELIAAGEGEGRQVWGDDLSGTSDEPVTVLAPSGEDGSSPNAVVVSLTGFEGHQGGLGQASGSDEFDEVLVVRGDDLAVRVVGIDKSEETLEAIARAVETDGDRRHAPTVPDPPGGLEVVGSMNADASIALNTHVSAFGGGTPGPWSAHSAGWIDGDRFLAVMTLPGTTTNLAALEGLRRVPGWQFHDVSVSDDGRSASVQRSYSNGGPIHYRNRAVAVRADFGDVVLVVAGGGEVPSMDVLVRIAGAVTPVGEAAWRGFVDLAIGSSPLEPDPEGIALERGKAGDVEWLFQALPARELANSGRPTTNPELIGITSDDLIADPCLKLSNRRRVCTSGFAGLGQNAVRSFANGVGIAGDRTFPDFVIVTTTTRATTVRVTTSEAAASGAFHELPGGGRWAAVVIVEGVGLPGCFDPNDARVPAALSVMRVELLNIEGRLVGCPSFGELP